MRNIKLTTTKPQYEFLTCDAAYKLFVAGYGAGKTETMITEALKDATDAYDALIGLYEPTYNLIRINLAPRVEARLIEWDIPYTYNKAEGIITTHTKQMGNFLLQSCDAPERLVAYEIYRGHIDEIDTLPMAQAQDVWNKLLGRIRQVPYGFTPDNVRNKLHAYSTPEGYHFAYNQWEQNNPDSEEYQLIRASSYSNPFLPKAYLASLEKSYTGPLKDAYLHGYFRNLKSGTVYYSYKRKDNDTSETIRPNEPLYVGMDFNVRKMAATIAVKRGKDYHVVDEIINGLDTKSVIKIIQDNYLYDSPHRKIYVYPDSTGARNTSQGASQSDIALLEKAGFIVFAKKTNPRVKNRVNAVNRAFEDNRVFVSAENCPQLAKCLEQQAYGKNGEPDKTRDMDHANDALGYFVNYEMPVHSPIQTAEIQFQ